MEIPSPSELREKAYKSELSVYPKIKQKLIEALNVAATNGEFRVSVRIPWIVQAVKEKILTDFSEFSPKIDSPKITSDSDEFIVRLSFEPEKRAIGKCFDG